MTEHLPRTAERRRSGEPLRLTVFGSSTTEGYGASDPPTTGYPARMRAALLPAFRGGISLVNRGVSGENIETMAPRINAVLSDRPDLVVWQAGSNDGPQGVTVARFEEIMSDGIARIAATGADLILMEPQYCPVLEASPDFRPFLDSVRALGRRFDLPVFPRYAAMQAWSIETGLGIGGLSPDGMHMDDVGYRLLGEAVAAFILQGSALDPLGL